MNAMVASSISNATSIPPVVQKNPFAAMMPKAITVNSTAKANATGRVKSPSASRIAPKNSTMATAQPRRAVESDRVE